MAADLSPVAIPRQVDIAHEFELLVACCCEHRGNAGDFTQVDAGRFVQLASRHGVLPRVYEAAKRFHFTAELRDWLRSAFETHTRRVLRLTSELVRVVDHLENRGAAVLPYKGPALAQILYGNVAGRQFGDLDLLVRSRDVARAKAALVELGYTATLQLNSREERAYIESGYEYVFDRGRERNLIELHWRVLPRFYAVEFDIEEMFEKSVFVEFGGQSIPTLCPEDMVLVLCVHAAKHAWTNLSWLCDLAELARGKRMDWAAVEERARRLGIQRIVAVTFSLANKILGADADVSPIEDSDAGVEDVAEHLARIMRDGGELDVESPGYFRLMMRIRERWRDQLRVAWRLGSTPGVGEWRAVRMPGRLFPLYRLVRPVRLAVKATTFRARPSAKKAQQRRTPQ